MGAQIIVAGFGLLITAASLWAIAAPNKVVAVTTTVVTGGWGMSFAVGVRVVLGVALLMSASASLFELLFRVFGVISLLAAAVIPFLGRERILQVLQWVAGLPTLALRCWLIFGVAFGLFLAVGANVA